ncbi:DMT family transporter [Pseudomonas azotoformans]|nr:DMT family transporter [Pseudomonas azotoformans]SDN24571.1 EamA-like transporter family protein [Pseudomonas azotoformans]
MQTSVFLGVSLAVIATLGWALNFIAPYVTGDYSLFDFIAVRYLMAGALGSMGLILYRAQLRCLGPHQLWVATGLGVTGCLGYGACIAAGVVFGGPVLTPTFVSMVPVLLALLGNARHKTVPWRRLAIPLGFLTAGLLVSNLSSLQHGSTNSGDWLAGLFFSVVAVMVWVGFSVINQKHLQALAPCATGAWTALMLVGSGVATLCLVPVAQSLGLFKLPTLGFGFALAGPMYAWCAFIALMSTLIGAWAWNAATQRLPMVLSSQLIALESLFASLLGLCFNARWPTLMETAGMTAVLIGVLLAVRNILAARPPATTLHTLKEMRQ